MPSASWCGRETGSRSLPGEEHAHQLLADRGVDLAYLCLSTTSPADIVSYQDSKKLLATGSPPDATPVRKVFWQKDGDVHYFAGEGERKE